MNAVEKAGVESIIEKWSGLKTLFVEAGPSVSDPAGVMKGYISFRDKHGKALAIGFDDSGLVEISTVSTSGQYESRKIWTR